jgi:hypothetical protein
VRVCSCRHTYMANARAYVKTYEDHSKMSALTQFDMHQELGSIEVSGKTALPWLAVDIDFGVNGTERVSEKDNFSVHSAT